MDYSPGSDGMDWREDSSLHIIQPASGPWRKRSFDTYNDTLEPYRPNESSGYQINNTFGHDHRPHGAYSGYQVNNTFGNDYRPHDAYSSYQVPNDAYSGYQVNNPTRNDDQVVAPYRMPDGRPAHYVTDSNGSTVLEPIVQREPWQPIGHYLPEVVKCLIYGTVMAIGYVVEFVYENSDHYTTVAVQVGNSAKRRLIQFAKNAKNALIPAPPPPPPPPQRHRHHVSPRHRRTHIIRRISPTSPGGRTHIPVTPPRAHPKATTTGSVAIDHDCLKDHIRSGPDYVIPSAFVTSHENDHPMSDLTYHPEFEPLMSGALQNMDIDEDAPSNTTSILSPYHVPGTFPDPPAPQVPSSTETPALEAQASDDLAVPCDLSTYNLAASNQQAVDEGATLHGEVSAEPDIPAVEPIIELPLQPVDTRPRNYKGELLSDWQIKICKEFQAIHPPPKKIQRQASKASEQPQVLNSSGSIELHRSPLANSHPMTPHQKHGVTFSGSIRTRRSPIDNVLHPGAASRTMNHNGSTTELTSQSHGMASNGLNGLHRSPLDLPASTKEPLRQPPDMTSTGLNDLHRSPMDLHSAATDIFHYSHVPTSIGSNDSHRSPLDLRGSTTKILHQPPCMTIGSNDLHRSPLDLDKTTLEILQKPCGTFSVGSNNSYGSPSANVPPTTGGEGLHDSDETTSDTAHKQLKMTTIGSTNSLRSPLVSLSPVDPQHKITTTSESQPVPLVNVSPNIMQLGTNSAGLDNSPSSPLAATTINAASDVLNDSHMADPEILEKQWVETPVPLENPPTNGSSMTTMASAKSPSKWSLRSLYARVQGKPKSRSPLCERANNGNVNKAPKTPKKVTWPENGPVTGTKRFLKHQSLTQPSPSSSREDSSILSSVPSDFSPHSSPTMQEEEEEDEEGTELYPLYQAYSPKSSDDGSSMRLISPNTNVVLNSMPIFEHTEPRSKSDHEKSISSSSSGDDEASLQSLETPTKSAATDSSTPPSHLFPKLEELTISTRRSSLRRREKEDQAQKLRDAIAAEEKARKDREEAEEKAHKEKEAAQERARIKAEEEEERKKTGGRRMPIEQVIQALPSGWDEKVKTNMAKGMREQLAMTSVGNPLTRRDFGMILPQPGTGDDPSGWLNDEIISGYLQAVVDHGHQAMSHPRGAKPRMHAFTPFFYTTLKDRGYDAVKRWSSRAKIGGNDLKTVEYVFIPCNPSRSHWTLIVVSPVRKTIEVFDSMHGSSSDKVETIKNWLRGEMGRSYVDSEWTVVEDPRYPGRGKGPVQNNANDCGVFAVTTAKMIVLGVDPMAVSAADMPLQRRRLVAELLNGGFSGEFKPSVVFE